MLNLLKLTTCGRSNSLFHRTVPNIARARTLDVQPRTFVGWSKYLSNVFKNCYQINNKLSSEKSSSTPTKSFSDEQSHRSGTNDVDMPTDLGGGQELQEYEQIAKRYFTTPGAGHQVIVLQPYVKWGPKKKAKTTPDLQLAEAVALVHSLENWKVVFSLKVPLHSLDKKTLFGHGSLEVLQEKVKSNELATAVFISVDLLKGYQQSVLEEIFGLPIFDRYSVVMQIFRERAVTKEAKIQVAMAEIPYLWSKIHLMYEGEPSRQGYGGPGESYTEMRRRILANREHKLKTALEKLRSQRELLRNKRHKHEYPTVAVVGYTNAGKTSLIKALTGEEALQPKDVLFATLDVTVHAGILPSKLKVLYVDTVGFISDIPTNLIESFNATLEDALLADLVLHVCDISHPDALAQSMQVTKTLQSLNISEKLKSNILVIGNKVDLAGPKDKHQILGSHALSVSSVTHAGVDILKERIEKSLLKITGRKKIIFRVPMGGSEASWLYKEAAVTRVEACPENNQYSLITVIITSACLERFRHKFIQKS
ncbi:putative GTP-binding protein 6 [Hetaerina americana]|uniref:putative GTP-binding protein 6 n=1 Tax=Hetaerina americana TaxID=62018 RepID=UPI003A7F2128